MERASGLEGKVTSKDRSLGILNGRFFMSGDMLYSYSHVMRRVSLPSFTYNSTSFTGFLCVPMTSIFTCVFSW